MQARQTFRLTVELGNAALEDPAELSRVLRRVANDIDRHVTDTQGTYTDTVQDMNGNTVGQWKIRA